MKNFFSGVGAIVMAVVFLAAGIFCIYMGADRLQKMNAGKYVETKATVTNIEKEEIYDSDSPGDTRTEYHITVEYSVDGNKYVSKLGETPSEFNEGMELTVLYNVDNPSEVVLPGNTGSYVMIGIGVVGVLAGIALFLKKLRGR